MVSPLIALVEDSGEDWQVRAAVLATLGHLGGPDGAEPILRALRARAWRVLEAAARTAAGLPADRTRGPLAMALQDPIMEVRRAAAEALGVQGDWDALPVLRERAEHDTGPSVRRCAVAACAQIIRREPC